MLMVLGSTFPTLLGLCCEMVGPPKVSFVLQPGVLGRNVTGVRRLSALRVLVWSGCVVLISSLDSHMIPDCVIRLIAQPRDSLTPSIG